MVLLHPNFETSLQLNKGDDRRGKGYKASHYTPAPMLQDQTTCYFCDGECPYEHIQTKGPGGVMVIQYFSCKHFANKTPRERLTILRRKGLCFQCLLPGAKSSEGKHHDGKCQHDFACKHPYHQQWSVKKHVLVCEKHKDTEENQKLLETYKSRCINKNYSLPTFAREIKLSFHTDGQTDTTRIYLLQKVSINNNIFTIFFDNGCSDFIIRKDAIKRLGPNVVKLFDGCINIGGVGGTSAKSDPGIYSVKIPLLHGEVAQCQDHVLTKSHRSFPANLLQLQRQTSKQHLPFTEVILQSFQLFQR